MSELGDWRRKTGLVCLTLVVGQAVLAQDRSDDAAPKYHLVLTGGHVVDPANNIDGPRDVAVADGKIAAIEADISARDARRQVDVSGLYVSPGFIDIHAHVSAGRFLARPSHPPDMNLASGLTTIVDAGTWGARDFHLLKRYHIDRAQIRILAFLNIASQGMGAKETDPNEQELKYLDPKLCAETIQRFPEQIVGVKTAHYWTSKPFDETHPAWASVELAVEAGEMAGVPVMVDFWPRPERPYPELLLRKLRPGDIHTHVFAQQFPIIDQAGRVYDYMFEARERGIVFDLGHGAGSFWFRNAAPAIEQNLIPDTISTDLHMRNVNGPVVDMITTMSKIMALGVPLMDVIRRSTINPARVIRRPELGTLSVGSVADVAVFELRRGRFGYTDCGRAKMVGDVKLENRMTIRAGRVVYDPEGLSMVNWRDAPEQYYSIPKLQGVSPRATADPDYRGSGR